MRLMGVFVAAAVVLAVVELLVLAVVTLALVAVIAVGTRAVWLESVRRYDLTHGRRVAGGIGGRRRLR